MLLSTHRTYSLLPREVEHGMQESAKVQRPGSSRSMEQTCYAKTAGIEHKRACSDPPASSYRSSFARLRRTISAPVNQQPEVARGRRPGAKELGPKKTPHETIRAPIKLVYQPEGLQAPPPMRNTSTDLQKSTRNFIRASLSAASHDGRGAALPLPPPPPLPGQHIPRPLSTLEEEAAEAEALHPANQLLDCKPWIPTAIESPTRAHNVAPPPLKLRAPIKEGTNPPPALVLNIPAKDIRPVPAPATRSPPPPKPASRPRIKKRVRFAPTSPEIITPASTKAVAHHRAQNPRGKQHPSWSAVFLLSAPSSGNDSDNRPSTSPGPQIIPQQHTNTKSILRRSNSFQNMRQEPEDPDSDVEIKPLEDHVYLIINAAMEKNLKRLPRNKSRQQLRKNNPLPALPVFAETPPTPTHNPNLNHDETPQYAHHGQKHYQQHPASPPSPPLPLSSRKFRHPVVVNHPPSPPYSSSSSRDGSPDSSRSTSSERDEMMFKMFAPEPLQISRVNVSSMKGGKKEERVGRGRPERLSWSAVA